MSKGLFLLYIVVVVATCGLAQAEYDISKINMNDLQQQLPADFPNQNETLSKAKALLQDKCISVAGKENGTKIYEEFETGVSSFGECVLNIVNYTAIQTEIESSKADGNLDLVFNKYCNKRPEALKCIDDLNEKILSCMDEEEQKNQAVIMGIVRSLLNFVCHKNGNQIALFIAEKGPECLESKKDDIQQCINSTFADYIPKEGIENVKTLPKFVIGAKQCSDIQHLETCIVQHLEKCSEITPANIIESMFRFIKNETICGSMPLANHQKSGAEVLLTGSLRTFISLALLFALSKIMQ